MKIYNKKFEGTLPLGGLLLVCLLCLLTRPGVSGKTLSQEHLGRVARQVDDQQVEDPPLAGLADEDGSNMEEDDGDSRSSSQDVKGEESKSSPVDDTDSASPRSDSSLPTSPASGNQDDGSRGESLDAPKPTSGDSRSGGSTEETSTDSGSRTATDPESSEKSSGDSRPESLEIEALSSTAKPHIEGDPSTESRSENSTTESSESSRSDSMETTTTSEKSSKDSSRTEKTTDDESDGSRGSELGNERDSKSGLEDDGDDGGDSRADASAAAAAAAEGGDPRSDSEDDEGSRSGNSEESDDNEDGGSRAEGSLTSAKDTNGKSLTGEEVAKAAATGEVAKGDGDPATGNAKREEGGIADEAQGDRRADLEIDDNTGDEQETPTVVLTIRGSRGTTKKPRKKKTRSGNGTTTTTTYPSPTTLGPSIVLAGNGTRFLTSNGTSAPADKTTLTDAIDTVELQLHKITNTTTTRGPGSNESDKKSAGHPKRVARPYFYSTSTTAAPTPKPSESHPTRPSGQPSSTTSNKPSSPGSSTAGPVTSPPAPPASTTPKPTGPSTTTTKKANPTTTHNPNKTTLAPVPPVTKPEPPHRQLKASTSKPAPPTPNVAPKPGPKLTTRIPMTPKPTPKTPTAAPKPTASAAPKSSTTRGPPKPNTNSASSKPNTTTKTPAVVSATTTASGGCPAAGKTATCQCDYKNLKDSDKLVAVVITKKGGFKGRRINSKAFTALLNSNLEAAANIGNGSNADNFVFPAGHYYFPRAIRFAQFRT